jgi:hypothetical protein
VNRKSLTVFRLVAVAVLVSLGIMAHFTLLRQGVCPAILDSGQPDCSINSRLRYFSQNLGVTAFGFFVSFCMGAFGSVAFFSAIERYRKDPPQ